MERLHDVADSAAAGIDSKVPHPQFHACTYEMARRHGWTDQSKLYLAVYRVLFMNITENVSEKKAHHY